MENVAGLGLLLQKLEYNALSPNARKVSDYGVPFKLLDCYDSKTPYDNVATLVIHADLKDIFENLKA